MNLQLLQEGRLRDLLDFLKKNYSTEDINSISLANKIKAICLFLDLTINQFDELIAFNSPVLRTVKGHAFEAAFEKFIKMNGYNIVDVGGDTDVDLSINGYSLQLKTPYLAGTTDDFITYKTHKTHGAKSNLESISYYHTVEEFADFFVGLISYNPFKVFIIPKGQLPKLHGNRKYIESPFCLSTSKFKNYINKFTLLGLNIDSSISVNNTNNNELLPQSSKIIGVNTDIIIDTILRECNFRIWDMSIRGFAREITIKQFLKKTDITYSDKPLEYRNFRADKADLVLLTKRTKKPIFIQIKGISINNCDFSKENPIIATETQLTRGRINNHPTQSRLYLEKDFEYLFLALDPAISLKINRPYGWRYYLIPTTILKKHHMYTNRIAPIQRFSISELEQYLVSTKQMVSLFDY